MLSLSRPSSTLCLPHCRQETSPPELLLHLQNLLGLKVLHISPLRPRHPLLRTKLRAFVIFAFSAEVATLGFLRLAGDLRRHCRRGHLLEVRDSIADPAVSLDCAAVAGAAGDEPLSPLSFCRTRVGIVPSSVPTKLIINCANLWLINAKDVLKTKTCLKSLASSLCRVGPAP